MEREPRDSTSLERVADLLKRSNIDPDDVERINRANVWDGFIKNKNGEIEYAKLASVSFVPKQDDRRFPQAVAAHITPSRKRPPKRDYKSIFVFSDTQIDYRRIGDELIPIHDERAMAVARLICADIRPNTIVNCGDTTDLSAFSRFKADSDHFHATIGPAFQRTNNMYAEYRADNPQARIVEADSNHNVRLRNWMLKYMPQMYNVKQAGASEEDYPVMSYPYLANLNSVGVDWVGGYGAAEFKYADDLIFRHGTKAVSRGSTAAQVSDPEVNIVQGHAHRTEIFYRTARDGTPLASVVVGALCKTTGEVPSYYSAVDDRNQVVRYQENWTQSVLEIEDYGGGNYVFHPIPIRNGVARYKGKVYEAMLEAA